MQIVFFLCLTYPVRIQVRQIYMVHHHPGPKTIYLSYGLAKQNANRIGFPFHYHITILAIKKQQEGECTRGRSGLAWTPSFDKQVTQHNSEANHAVRICFT